MMTESDGLSIINSEQADFVNFFPDCIKPDPWIQEKNYAPKSGAFVTLKQNSYLTLCLSIDISPGHLIESSCPAISAEKFLFSELMISRADRPDLFHIIRYTINGRSTAFYVI